MTPIKSNFKKSALTLAISSQCWWAVNVYAGPEGGEIVGGIGEITQTDNITQIIQETDKLAIDWQSFNVDSDERVNFIQPDQNAVALNRILSSNGSEIMGRIDANGHVILINPRGIIFGKDAVVDTGGIIASGLDINPNDFINGHLMFKRLEGTDGAVINNGILNAAAGGNVALMGTQVENNGLITANMGTVTLASGQKTVLTFDNEGLLGVTVDEAILQDELGEQAAVKNTGEITAQGGRVLLSATKTKQVFDKIVNTGGQKQATSVIYNDDGSFDLTAGGNVDNSGTINTSADIKAGDVIVLGENIDNTGAILANSNTAKGGTIEINARDKNQTLKNGTVQANGHTGGDVKLLGNKVGLFDKAKISATGKQQGGQVLIGGDQEGLNQHINNADFVYTDEQILVDVSATDLGDAGRAILFAEDTAQFNGHLWAKGGVLGGNGGFIETSGKIGFSINNTPDISSAYGRAGEWLIDPFNITIDDGSNNRITNTNPFVSTGNSATLRARTLNDALDVGGTVTVKTGAGGTLEQGNITVNANIILGENKTSTLNLIAHNNITINNSISADKVSNRKLNIHLNANTANQQGSIKVKDGITLNTGGGDFKVGTIGTNDVIDTTQAGAFDVDFSGATIDVTGAAYSAADIKKYFTDFGTTVPQGRQQWMAPSGQVIINAKNDVALGSIKLKGREADNAAPKIDITAGRDIVLDNVFLYDNNPTEIYTADQKSNDGFTTLKLTADRDILLNNNIALEFPNTAADQPDQHDRLNIILTANSNNVLEAAANTSGSVKFANNVAINTSGGNFTILNSETLDLSQATINTQAIYGTKTYGAGNVNLTATGDITLGDMSGLTSNTTVNTSDLRAASLTVNSGGKLTLKNDLYTKGGDLNLTAFTWNFSGKNLTTTKQTNTNFSQRGDITLVTGGTLDLPKIDSVGKLILKTITDNTAAAITNSNTLVLKDVLEIDIKKSNAILNNLTNSVGDLLVQATSADALSITTTENILFTGANTIDKQLQLSTTKNIGQQSNSSLNADRLTINNADQLSLNLSNNTIALLDGTLKGGTLFTDTALTLDNLTITGTELILNHTNNVIINGALTGSTSGKKITLNGTSANNNYTISDGASWDNIILSMDGSTGLNTVNGPNKTATWQINSATDQSLSFVDNNKTYTATLKNMDILQSGNQNDTFTLTGAVPAGLQLKGGDGADIADYSGIVGTNTVTFSTAGLDSIETVKGNQNGNNSPAGQNAELALTSQNNTWTMTGVNAGKIENGNGVTIITFEGFNQLLGGDGRDIFNLDFALQGGTGGQISGGAGDDQFIFSNLNADAAAAIKIMGGAGVDDTADYSAVTGDLALTQGQHITDVETLTGNNTATLTASNAANNTWNITDTNKGNIVAGNSTTAFEKFNHFVGGTLKDDFILISDANSTGAVTGSIDGGTGTGVNTLTGIDDNLIWTITQDNTNKELINIKTDVVNNPQTLVATATNIKTLNAKNKDDRFVFDFTGSALTINAGDGPGKDTADYSSASGDLTVTLGGTGLNGIDALIGNNTATLTASNVVNANDTNNTWNITDTNKGNIVAGGATTTFEKFNHLVGGTLKDDFILMSDANSTGAVTGHIDGGTGNGVNTLTGINSNLVWAITKDNTNQELINIKTDVANNPQTLIASATHIKTLNAKDSNDRFAFNFTGSALTINAGDGLGNDTADYSDANGDITVTLGASGLTGIEALIGNNTATLTASNTNNTWNITDTNKGNIVAGNSTTAFEKFNHLVGASGVDTFNINADLTGPNASIAGSENADVFNINASVTAQLLGELGNDEFNVKDSVLNIANGGAGNDVFNLLVSNVTATLNGGDDKDTLNAFDQQNTWNLKNTFTLNPTSVALGETIKTITFNGLETLTGAKNQADTFVVTQDTTGLTIVAGDQGTDTIDYSAVDKNNPVIVTLGSAGLNGFESVIGNGGLIKGPDAKATWILGGAGNTQVTWNNNAATTAFSGFDTWQGGALGNDFTINTLNNAPSKILGGQGADTLNTEGVSDALQVAINDTNTLITGALNVSALEDIKVNQNAINRLTSNNQTTTDNWAITGLNAGTLNGLKFSGFSQLVGGLQNQLTLSDDGRLFASNTLGKFDAGSGTLNNLIMTSNADYLVDIKNAYQGDIIKQTLIDQQLASTPLLAFTNIKNITTGSGKDTFKINDTSRLNSLNSGDGVDTLNASAVTQDIKWTFNGTQGQMAELANNGPVWLNALLGLENLTSGAGKDTVELTQLANLNTLTTNAGDDVVTLNGPGVSVGLVDLGEGTDQLILQNKAKIITEAKGGNQPTDQKDSLDMSSYGDSVVFNPINATVGGFKEAGFEAFKAATGFLNTLEGALEAKNTWTIDGNDSVTLSTGSLKVRYENIGFLQGGNVEDDFILAGGRLTGSIQGGQGENSLTANNTDNTWTITNTNTGQLTHTQNNLQVADIAGFSNIQTLIGGSAQDAFIFNDNGKITGTLDGAGGADRLQAKLNNATQTWALQQPGVAPNLKINQLKTSTNVLITAFNNIETLTGSGNDHLIAGDQTNAWVINNTNAGTLNTALTFAGMANISGGAAQDTFNISQNGFISGVIKGGDGADNLTLTNTNTVIVDLGATTSNALNQQYAIHDVETITVENDKLNTLIGLTAPGKKYEWTLNQKNASLKELNTDASPNLTPALSLNNFSTWQGRGGEDNFKFIQLADNTQLIGGGGYDSADFAAMNGDVTVNLTTNTSLFAAPALAVQGIEQLIGNQQGLDADKNNRATLVQTQTNQESQWLIGRETTPTVTNSLTDGINDGTLTLGTDKVDFSGFNVLTGTTAKDTFTFTANGRLTGLIKGNGGADILDLSAIHKSDVTPLNINLKPVTTLAINPNNLWLEGFNKAVGSNVAVNIIGAGNATRLVAGDTANAWTLTAENKGQLKVDNQLWNFEKIGHLLGDNNTDDFTLTTNGALTGMLDGGLGANRLTSTRNGQTWQLKDAQPALLSLNPQQILTQFNGIQTLTGSGTDHLIAGDQTNNWVINSANAGTLNTALTFAGMANISGGAALDSFNFTQTGFISGAIKGGAGADSLTLNKTNAITVDLGSTTSNALDQQYAVSDIETITANNTAANIVKSANELAAGYQWTIKGKDDISIKPTLDATADKTVKLINFTQLLGGNKSDQFGLIANTGITQIDGGEGNDFTDYSGIKANINISLDGGTTTLLAQTSDNTSNTAAGITVKSIEGIVGNHNGQNTAPYNAALVATQNNNYTWTLGALNQANQDGLNDGQFTDANGKTTYFKDFNIVVSGAGNDTFKVMDTGILTGGIFDLGGQNILDASGVTRDAKSMLDIALVADANNASIAITPTAVKPNQLKIRGVQTLSGKLGATRLVADQTQANIWALKGDNKGTVKTGNTTWVFNTIGDVLGGNNKDDFNLTENATLNGLLDGGAGDNSLWAEVDTQNVWHINTEAQGTLTHIDGYNKTQYVQDATTATPLLRAQNIKNLNAAGSDWLLAKDALDRNWQITGVGQGYLKANSQTLNFSGMSRLIGGLGKDDMEFTNTGFLAGYADGGAGVDKITFKQDKAIILALNTDTSDALINQHAVKGFETLLADNNLSTNTLVGPGDNSSGYLWTLSSTEQSVKSINALDTQEKITFINFANLMGGQYQDIFEITATQKIKSLDGGGGDDRINASGFQQDLSIWVDNPTLNTQYTLAEQHLISRNIEEIIGNNNGLTNTTRNTTLLAPNGLNTWSIGAQKSIQDGAQKSTQDGINDGLLQFEQGNVTQNIVLENINQWQGGDQKDTINMIDGRLTGWIDAAAGDDAFNYHLSKVTAAVNFKGGQGTDSLSILGDNADQQLSYAIQNNKPVLIFTHGATDAPVANSLSYTDLETIQLKAPLASVTLAGRTEEKDTITLGNSQNQNLWQVNQDTPIFWADNTATNQLTVINQLKVTLEPQDNLQLNGNIALKEATFVGGQISALANATLKADRLNLDSVNTLGTQEAYFNTAIQQLAVKDLKTSLYLKEANELTLADLNTGGDLYIQVDQGNLTQSQAFNTSANLNLTTASGNINLSQAQNTFKGQLNLTAQTFADFTPEQQGVITLQQQGAIALGNITADTFNLTSTGAVTDQGNLTIKDLVIKAPELVFDNDTNIIEKIAVTGASDIALRTQSNLILNTIEASKTLDINTAGALTLADGAQVSATEQTTLKARSIAGGNTSKLITPKLIAEAQEGINLYTQTAHLNIKANTQITETSPDNSGAELAIYNIGDVTVEKLHNLGDIKLFNNSSVTFLQNSVSTYVKGNTLYPEANIREKPGFGGNFVLDMIDATGNIITDGTRDRNNPHIAANAVTLLNPAGTFIGLSPVIYAPERRTIRMGRARNKPEIGFGIRPDVVEDDTRYFGTVISPNEQMIETEDLGSIPIEIFSYVTNFYWSEISILMPRDQRDDDEDEDQQDYPVWQESEE